eukprot:TRINITY_DN8238_c0_g1_i1.p1 TRINITY_DN8238_c0_g1~~TRINITY_DN8238_c0_g1_i1.p1  ORF type:complete len:539 (+),score=107.56 TRINITY_DN8238_c0_g1_i1:120-1736(+)
MCIRDRCDDGANKPGDGCSVDCRVEPGWACAEDGCKPVRGDGIRVLDREACDDKNLDKNDGCSPTCQVELGWECALAENAEQGDVCSPSCGDGLRLGNEQCDDGNRLDGDGCSSECHVEQGWRCPQAEPSEGDVVAPSECVELCGDGVHEDSEGCDDGNKIPGDGCSAGCAVEPEWYCLPQQGKQDQCARIQDCEVGDWGEWSPCTAECAGGHMQRSRETAKKASPGGASCAALIEHRECHTQSCPAVNCTTSEWSPWQPCTLPCGTGHKSRARKVHQPAEHGGASCGLLDEQVACNTHQCPIKVDCSVSVWAAWGQCSKSCGRGTHSRSRSIAAHPTHDGLSCPALNETRSCNTQGCPPRDCVTTDWSNWTACTKPCGTGESERHRGVLRQPELGGRGCGQMTESRACNTQICAKPAVNCLEGPWGSWSMCSATCGGGESSRLRAIMRAAENAGARCGELEETRECNTQRCLATDCSQSAWSDWGKCSESCGGGTMHRTRRVLANATEGGNGCGANSQARECNTQPCDEIELELLEV